MSNFTPAFITNRVNCWLGPLRPDGLPLASRGVRNPSQIDNRSEKKTMMYGLPLLPIQLNNSCATPTYRKFL